MVTKMREKGQVTIPMSIRTSLHLSKNSMLSVAKIGDGILLMPNPSVYKATSTAFAKEAKEKGVTLNSLLKDLKKLRRAKSS